MTIKELFEKIKNLFSGKKIKELPEGSPKGELANTREDFLTRTKEGVQPQEKIDMERDFQQTVEEYSIAVKQANVLISKIYLNANGIEFDENDDVVNLAEEEKIKHVEKSIEGKDNWVSKEISKIFAEQKWEDNKNEYMESAFATYVESKQREARGEKTVLSDDEKRKVQEIEGLISAFTRYSIASGKILGMQHSAYSHGLTTEDNIGHVKEIEEVIERDSILFDAFKEKSNTKALESSDVTDIDRIMYTANKVDDAFTALYFSNTVASHDEAFARYNVFIENGGKVPSLDTFDNKGLPSLDSSLVMSENEIQEILNNHQDKTESRENEENIR